jgi:hypothetical protein
MADKAVIYQKTARRVPIAKVPDEAVENAIRKANVDLGLDPYGPPGDRYADAAALSKVFHLDPRELPINYLRS